MLMMIGKRYVKKNAREYDSALFMIARLCFVALFDLLVLFLMVPLVVAVLPTNDSIEDFNRLDRRDLFLDDDSPLPLLTSARAATAVRSTNVAAPNFCSFFSCSLTALYIIAMVAMMTQGKMI